MNEFYLMGDFILNNEGSDVGSAAFTMVTDLNLWLCMIFMLPPKTILIKISFAPLTLNGQITKEFRLYVIDCRSVVYIWLTFVNLFVKFCSLQNSGKNVNLGISKIFEWIQILMYLLRHTHTRFLYNCLVHISTQLAKLQTLQILHTKKIEVVVQHLFEEYRSV